MDYDGGSKSSDLSLEEVMEEYSSRSPQFAEWLWCIEYIAKFLKDLRCIHDVMNMGSQYPNVYGRRIDEVLSLRILECMFDPNKNCPMSVDVASTSEESVEFDVSMSNADVLRAILKEIQLSELRTGMPELSKFNVLPFIAHKNMCLQQCALEKLRDVSLLENLTSPDSPVVANDPVFREDRSVDMEETTDEQQALGCLEQNINGKDKDILSDDEDEPMDTNQKDEVVVINGDTESDQDITNEPINNGNTTGKTIPPEDAHVKCTKEGIWLISVSDDDESEMVKSQGLIKTMKNTNTCTNILPSRSKTRPKNLCWKCGKGGTLLICSRSECASKVHKECLKCEVNVDEEGNFHCPVCWYDIVVEEYLDSQKFISSAQRNLVKFMHLLTSKGNRLR
ncbi:unnamed protein product [Cochlearia groenlandica]